ALFENATTAYGLTLEELSGVSAAANVRVAIAAYPVQFDSNQGLWFCDFTLDHGITYGFFVRLALARYQPKSNPGLELSRVVLADFVQQPPDRTVTVSAAMGDPNRFEIQVGGLTGGVQSPWHQGFPRKTRPSGREWG